MKTKMTVLKLAVVFLGFVSLINAECIQFEVFSKKRTWEEAASLCEEQGMVLARDLNDRTHETLVKTIKAQNFVPEKDFWINGRKNEDGDMQTLDGLVSNNTYYDPTNPTGNGNCLHLWQKYGYQWDDDACNRTKYYICEHTCGCIKYKLVSGNKLPWDEAALSCEENGMSLARDLNAETHNIMVDMIESKDYEPPKDVWINGIMNADEQMEFTDGIVTNFTYYDETNPSRNGDCLQLWTRSGYNWDDDICVKTKYYMCERECCGWYETNRRKMTWEEAQAACEAEDMILARDLNMDVHIQLVNLINSKNYQFNRNDFWINGRKNWAGKMQTTDKLVSTFTNFAETGPNEEGDCLHMSNDIGFKWNNSDCNERKRFICEKVCF